MDKKAYIEAYYHGEKPFTYRCKICGHSLDRNIYDYCPWCGGNLRTGQLAVNLYAEGFRNGLSAARMLREESDLDG